MLHLSHRCLAFHPRRRDPRGRETRHSRALSSEGGRAHQDRPAHTVANQSESLTFSQPLVCVGVVAHLVWESATVVGAVVVDRLQELQVADTAYGRRRELGWSLRRVAGGGARVVASTRGRRGHG